MSKRVRSGKRVLAKKVTSFNLYADQATQIQAIMEATGAERDAQVLRALVDEALAARRRKAAGIEASEQPPPVQEISETLQTIQTLLLKMISQGQTSFRAQGISLVLLQEILAEARAGREISWTSLVVPALREKGISLEVVQEQFDDQTGSQRLCLRCGGTDKAKSTNSKRRDERPLFRRLASRSLSPQHKNTLEQR